MGPRPLLYDQLEGQENGDSFLNTGVNKHRIKWQYLLVAGCPPSAPAILSQRACCSEWDVSFWLTHLL